jgi:DNA gyrase subunit A
MEIVELMKENMQTYSTAVNELRAIPDARTGLKPIHRKIIFEMYADKINSNSKYKKCAYMVGQLISRFTEHGDASTYDSLVRLAQPWIQFYPLLDFHGNYGSQFGDGPAAMRYTEARLSKIAEDGFLQGLDKKNVDWIPNFTNEEEEPETLPAIFPGLFCLPNQGMGYGCACHYLTYNLNEVKDMIINYINTGEVDNIYPDLASGGTIINPSVIKNVHSTGKGSIIVDSKYTINKNNIIITEIPFNTPFDDIYNQIVELCKKEEITYIDDILNNSGEGKIELLIKINKSTNPENAINDLLSRTKLRCSYPVNQVALMPDKSVKLLTTKDMIDVYIDHNTNCIKREHQFDYGKAIARIHILEGLLIALSNIEDVIEIIRHSANPSTELTNRFNLDDIQVKAILDMKLSRLSKLEEDKLIQEKEEKEDFAAKCKKVVESEDEQKNILVERLSNLAKKYGTPRRTQVIQKDIVKTIGSKKKTEEVVKDIVVAFNPIGYVQAIPVTQYRNNGFDSFKTTTKDLILLFSNQGRFFRISGKDIKECGPKDKGTAIGSIIKLNEGEKIINISSMDINDKRPYLLFTINNGMIKKIDKTEFIGTTRNLNGMMACKLKENSSVVSINETNGCIVTLVTKSNYVISFEAEDVRLVGRAAAGVKGINLGVDDEVVECIISDSNASKVKTNLGNLEIHVQKRGGKGKIVKK